MLRWRTKLAHGTWNMTSPVRKEPELLEEVERFSLPDLNLSGAQLSVLTTMSIKNTMLEVLRVLTPSVVVKRAKWEEETLFTSISEL